MYKLLSWSIILVAILYLVSCSSQKKPTGVQEITITVKADETIVVNDEVISIDTLVDKLQALGISEETHVRMQVDGDVEMGSVQKVQEILRSRDAAKVSYSIKLM